jgi:predicted O-methyltransferase YrrM
MVSIEQINNEYNNNIDYYTKISNTVTKNINGRSCHQKVILLTLIQKFIRIDAYLEIGVHNGTSMSFIVHQPRQLTHCIGVDLFENTIPPYTNDKLSYNKSYTNIMNNNISNSPITLIAGNSFHSTTVDLVEIKLNSKLLDILFIDALHSYSGIKNDFETYNKFVKKGGFIIIDDYNSSYQGIVKYVKDEIESNPKYTIIGTFLDNELIVKVN